jgi:hypothetical protein
LEERLEEGSWELLALCFGAESPARTASPLMYVFDHGSLLMLFTAVIIAVAFLYLALLLAFTHCQYIFLHKQANATAVLKLLVLGLPVTCPEVGVIRATHAR